MATKNEKINENETKRPDYIAKQYRAVRIEGGWKTRKERIGGLWRNDDGSLTFRPSGAQLIEGDVYFFPAESDEQA